jgi:hypothetical protein
MPPSSPCWPHPSLDDRLYHSLPKLWKVTAPHNWFVWKCTKEQSSYIFEIVHDGQTFANAVTRAGAVPHAVCAGAGYDFPPVDDSHAIWCIELRATREPTSGELELPALEAIEHCPGAYIEISPPTGDGIRILGHSRHDIPERLVPLPRTLLRPHLGKLEDMAFLDFRRMQAPRSRLALSGWCLKGQKTVTTPADISDGIKWLWQKYVEPPATDMLNPPPQPWAREIPLVPLGSRHAPDYWSTQLLRTPHVLAIYEMVDQRLPAPHCYGQWLLNELVHYDSVSGQDECWIPQQLYQLLVSMYRRHDRPEPSLQVAQRMIWSAFEASRQTLEAEASAAAMR